MLTQTEADQFIQMVKHFVRAPASITIPPGADDTYELASLDDRESFLLDIWRGTLRLTKLKFQNRVRTAIVLSASTWMERLTLIQMDKDFRARICTCSEKATTTDGRIL